MYSYISRNWSYENSWLSISFCKIENYKVYLSSFDFNICASNIASLDSLEKFFLQEIFIYKKKIYEFDFFISVMLISTVHWWKSNNQMVLISNAICIYISRNNSILIMCDYFRLYLALFYFSFFPALNFYTKNNYAKIYIMFSHKCIFTLIGTSLHESNIYIIWNRWWKEIPSNATLISYKPSYNVVIVW